jgi:hypothetical protein
VDAENVAGNRADRKVSLDADEPAAQSDRTIDSRTTGIDGRVDQTPPNLEIAGATEIEHYLFHRRLFLLGFRTLEHYGIRHFVLLSIRAGIAPKT